MDDDDKPAVDGTRAQTVVEKVAPKFETVTAVHFVDMGFRVRVAKMRLQDRTVGSVGTQAAMLSDVFEVLDDGCIHSQAGGLRLDKTYFRQSHQTCFDGSELD